MTINGLKMPLSLTWSFLPTTKEADGNRKFDIGNLSEAGVIYP
jgi:hypothetical protein